MSGSTLSAELRTRLLELVDEARRLSQEAVAADGEAILRGLVEALPCAALAADSKGRYVVANPAASALTGYSNEQLRALSVWELTPPDLEHDAEKLWRAFLQLREQTGFYILIAQDGRAVWTAYAASADVLPGLHVSLMSRP